MRWLELSSVTSTSVFSYHNYRFASLDNCTLINKLYPNYKSTFCALIRDQDSVEGTEVVSVSLVS